MVSRRLQVVGALAATSYVAAQGYVSDPLIDKVVPYNAIPYQVDIHSDGRGPQSGYNICNSTTEGQSSMCQTVFVNHLDDLCLWAPPKPASTIGDTEGEEVGWCTKPGRGTRLIPKGALKGVQLVQSPGYIQIAGFIDQTMLNIADGDYGGELDSGGQDGRGNPIGGLVYTNAFPSNGGKNDSYQQSRHWTFFIGGNTFCAKVCDDTQPNAAKLCEHIYDRVGCAYNAPNNAQEGVFERCMGEDMSPVGTYTSNGQTLTWTQPPESLGPITSIPYTPVPAASSNCVTYASDELYNQLDHVTAPAGNSHSATTTATGTSSKATSTGNAHGTQTRSGSASQPSGAGNHNGTTTSNGATVLGASFVATACGVLFSMIWFV